MPQGRRTRSWIDVVTGAIDRLPGPAWVTYVILTVIAVVPYVGLRVLDGATTNFVNVIYAGLTFLPYAVLFSVNRAAKRSLADFRPALGDLEPEYDELERKLSTTSPVTAIVGALVGIGIVTVGHLTVGGAWGVTEETSLPTNIVTIGENIILNMGFVTFLLHAAQQVIVITRIHREATNIQLWYTPPHNAFARVTVVTAIVVSVPYAITQIVSVFLQPPSVIDLVLLVVTVVVAVLLFVSPLAGMRNRLVREKERQLNETDRALEVAGVRLRGVVDGESLAAADHLQNAISGLVAERDRLRKVSTWPWSADTIRAFLTSLGIPVLLWFLTTLLGRVLFG